MMIDDIKSKYYSPNQSFVLLLTLNVNSKMTLFFGISNCLIVKSSCLFDYIGLAARRKKQKTMDCAEALPVKIAIDMAFDEFMDENVSRFWTNKLIFILRYL